MSIISYQSDAYSAAVAVIGLNGRFPGAPTIQQFWQNLSAGIESVTFFEDDELEVDPRLAQQPNYVKAGILLENADLFDAEFFGLNPREAEMMDPQHRIFLECAWELLELIGYDSTRYDGRIGVYGGTSLSTYLLNNLYSNQAILQSGGAFQTILGNDKDFLASRVAYKLNLHGPSVTVQTACSTSLVAVHLACQALLNGECEMAIAGGVSVGIPQKAGYLYQEGMILSPDGHCRPFDAQAQGTLSGSGVGLVALKLLEDALEEGDTIQAIVRGTAVNNDGAVKVGYTAPSVEGQAKVIAEALGVAQVDPRTIGYVEAHGTGTSLGDPIEIEALTQAYQARTQDTQYCALGSVKSNVGHLDAAAGITSLIKTILALREKQIPPSINFSEPNPNIDFDQTPFYVNDTLRPWSEQNTPRRAGVSSFGIGGTNAHVIVEEAPPLPASTSSRPWQLLLLSHRSEDGLEEATLLLADQLQKQPQINLADMAYTLQTGRQRFEHRRFILCKERGDAVEILRSADPTRMLTHTTARQEIQTVFLFPGQGAQYVQMGRELYFNEPHFRQIIDQGTAILKPLINLDIRQTIFSGDLDVQAAESRLTQTSLAQPALFLVEYALAQLWLAWGIQPAAIIGHSVGELVAACLAGVFSFADGLKLITTRGRLMQSCAPGDMLTVSLSPSQLDKWLPDTLSLAAHNAPDLSVVSGPASAIQILAKHLGEANIKYNHLNTSHAFHSHMMEPILAEFRQQVASVVLNAPTIPLISNVTGTWLTDEQATDPEYWVQHLRQPVLFAQGIATLLQQKEAVFIEVGPGRTLSTICKQQPNFQHGQVVVTSLRHPQEDVSDMFHLLRSLGQLWLAGAVLDWQEFYSHEKRRRVPLPTYPFQRQRYWIESTGHAVVSLQKQSFENWFYLPSWQRKPCGSVSDEWPTNWLLFLDDHELSRLIVSRLHARGAKAIVVTTGESFYRVDDIAFQIRPDVAVDYENLFSALRQQNQLPQRIMHFWNLNENMPATAEAAKTAAFTSFLWLAQAIGQHAHTQPLHLTIVANGLFEVTGLEQLTPARTLLLGPARVIPQEYPSVTCQVMDLALSEQNVTAWVDQLLSDCAQPDEETSVAYRGSYRWAFTLTETALKAPTGLPFPLALNGTYLITGGLGNIGLSLAGYLAETAANLILLGRSAFPPRHEWDHWLASHDESDSVTQKIQRVRAFLDRGSNVEIVQADVSDPAQMAELVQALVAKLGRLDGVIHSAGVPGGRVIQLRETAVDQAVMAPKVVGTQILGDLLATLPLEIQPRFFLCCSSLNALLGGVGQVDYTAANAFMDAFAHDYSRKTGIPTIAVNWGAWADGGMAVETDVPETWQTGREAWLKQGIHEEEGVRAFQYILNNRFPQVAVSPLDIGAVQAYLRTDTASHEWEHPKRNGHPAELRPRPLLATAYVAPQDEYEAQIASIWEELLGIGHIGVHDLFHDLGGHSLLAVQVVSRVRDTFQIDLPLRELFEAPTIAAMAERIRVTKWAITSAEQGRTNPDILLEEGEL